MLADEVYYNLQQGIVNKNTNIFCRPSLSLLGEEEYINKLKGFNGYLCYSNPKVQYLFYKGFKPSSLEYLETFIYNRVTKNKVENWIVLNEVINTNGTLRRGPMSYYYGEDWVSLVVSIVRKYSESNLWICDTGLHHFDRWDTIRELATILNIGVGYHIHWDLTEGPKGIIRSISGTKILNYHISQTKVPFSFSEITVWGKDRVRFYKDLIDLSLNSKCKWVGIWVPTINEHWGKNEPCHFLENNS